MTVPGPVPAVPSAPDREADCGANCVACFAERHNGHDVGWRHEDGRLHSATCRDCVDVYRAASS